MSLTLLLLSIATPAHPQNLPSFTIQFPLGQNRFRVGETIPIELVLSSSGPDVFDMNTASYDRSGRLDIEQFHVTPAGRDPLHDYYAFGAFMGGGLRSSLILSSELQALHRDLNEWVSLDHPGHYTLYVTTSRVSRRTGVRNESVELQSNSLEFDLVAADPAWLQQAFFSAKSTLDNRSSTNEEKTAAIRALRFLDSPASVRELVQRLGKPDSSQTTQWDCVAGLAGSRQQNVVVKELEQQLAAPDVAITSDYLFILGRLKFQLEQEPLGPYPKDDEQQQVAWRDRIQKRNEGFAALEDDLYRTTATLVQKKWGSAEAETVRTLLMRPVHDSGDIKPLTSVPEGDIASAFRILPPEQQETLLATFWERLNLPAMAAPLEEIAQRPQIRIDLLRDIALQRLYQLNATAATPLILEEIAHPHVDNNRVTIKAETLSVLPNETLPQFDQTLASRLEQQDSPTSELDTQLVGRYATGAVLPRIKSAYLARLGDWDCKEEDGFVLYFLRVDPNYGVERLKQAPSVCMKKSLPVVIRLNRWNEIQPAVIAKLNTPDLNRAGQAAWTLAQYGDPAAEKALWRRLKSFHDQWADRKEDLIAAGNMHRATQPGQSDVVGFRYALVTAIGQAQGWILTDQQIADLGNLTFGQMDGNIKPWHLPSPVFMSVSILFDGRLTSDINHQYFPDNMDDLRNKLAQFPIGTKFQVSVFGQQERLAPFIQSIQDVAADHGLSLEFPTPAK